MSEIISRLLSVIQNRDFGADDVADTQSIYAILKEAHGTDLEPICCNLFDFTSNAEMRVGDRRHRQFQESELNKLIKLLKSGDLAQAKEISFLGES
jgi:hypothetical protein